MQEMTSNNDDLDKRLAIFFGLGAFIMSALVGLVRDYTLEGFLLQGVVVLVLATVGGYLFGAWLRAALASVEVQEDLPANMERRRTNAENLEQGSVVVPEMGGGAVVSEEDSTPQTGTVVNYTLPELSPMDLLAPAPAAAPMAAPAADVSDEDLGDLPPPPVPAWLK